MNGSNKIKVLVVEDSHVVRMSLVCLLDLDPQIQVIGASRNGREALEFVAENLPDVIVMDIVMPEIDGFEATRRIMESKPVPIVICSGIYNSTDSVTAFRLMEVGAVACIAKPLGRGHAGFDEMAARLLQTVKLMSGVKLVRRWPQKKPAGADALDSVRRQMSARRMNGTIDMIGIGASTGGPPVLQTILSSLPKDFPVPLLIVQHIAPGFVAGLAEWLNQSTALTVQIAAYGIRPQPGHVYLAPDDFHMSVCTSGQIILSKELSVGAVRPSVARLFGSLADVYGERAIGVLLTGMGTDGAGELKRMRDRNALTIVQDRESSVVHGMPAEAIALGAASRVLPADQIGPALMVALNP
jgi:two-component system, chemotaxis family, protein-glutamate methylesterase/glutaminase